MIGLDTSVLLRILIDDGSSNVVTARRFAADQVKNGKHLHVGHVVPAEIEWFLGSTYGYGRAQIATALGAVLKNGAYDIVDRDVLLTAWSQFQSGPADFVDCLIAAKHASVGCQFAATFDKAMRGLPTTRVLR